ncbi:TOG array regulator of axonemal microtubules protein 2-like isoform X3 [Trifolium pratense]|uniref:TOG array regulator of axonemal microtubules protein 2-like isoform X3 n=1 Tax=Trifolium pratense TaxID=57577 RepID=UPI001E697742|nr:TOG array regulator of axonemal microtubules protein 2-like isoform X3 [Trifolium pratense]
MALRPIDNALPTITQERPKKQPKIVVSTQKQQPRTSSNDENQVPSEPTIDYISSDNLKPMSDPEAQIQNLIGNLDSKNWVKVCESLNDVRRFALYNSSLLLPILDKILLVVVKSMKNPRSALCKTSIMAASDIFNAFGDKLFDPSTFEAFDGLLLQLLLKASQDKKFVCEEAEKALGSMVGSMTPLPLLLKLRVSVSHTNLRIRAKAAVSLSKCVSKMGIEGMEEFGMEKLIEVAADLVNDRLPEAREAARSIATSVYEAIIKNVEEVEEKMEVWQSFCHSKLTPINALSILKIVKP